jgi:hypothetical protein
MAISKFNYNSFNVTPVAGKALSFNSDADGFTTQGASSMTLIKTLTASSSANLSFVDGSSSVVLDDTYPVYKFVFTSIHPSAGQAFFRFNLSTDSGSNYNVTKTSTHFNALHSEDGTSSASLSYNTSSDLAQSTADQTLCNKVGNGNDESASGCLYLFNPSSTTFVKHYMSDSNYYHQGGDVSRRDLVGGYGNTTSAIDAVKFLFSSGNIDAGTIKLYGIKDS